MLHLTVLSMGRLKEPYYIDACREYQKRLTAYCRLEITELPEDGDIVGKIPKGAYVIALCIEGEKTDSPGLAARLETLANQGRSRICLLIGGSEGLPPAAKARADWKLSMSDMTFPHHLARVMLLEQLYRAMSITAGAKYHK
ncbi:MAG: 23S rRNA (pseudouridine(1915)-N(3))-methyltransferase RlmH [Oscillospiraceae bacterium]|nr:23S rRNA (pseudouridine(1915)-N(3))-methyltransferase RlmH [Oscillospiraceae bacterium]